jgi:hypothetical protein
MQNGISLGIVMKSYAEHVKLIIIVLSVIMFIAVTLCEVGLSVITLKGTVLIVIVLNVVMLSF